jgi:hypothetical protein
MIKASLEETLTLLELEVTNIRKGQ